MKLTHGTWGLNPNGLGPEPTLLTVRLPWARVREAGPTEQDLRASSVVLLTGSDLFLCGTSPVLTICAPEK